jgi:hypothetical protein
LDFPTEIFHATLPASGSASSLKLPPDLVSESSCASVSPGRKTKPLAVAVSLAKTASSIFDQSICAVLCASAMCGSTEPSRTRMMAGIVPASIFCQPPE